MPLLKIYKFRYDSYFGRNTVLYKQQILKLPYYHLQHVGKTAGTESPPLTCPSSLHWGGPPPAHLTSLHRHFREQCLDLLSPRRAAPHWAPPAGTDLAAGWLLLLYTVVPRQKGNIKKRGGCGWQKVMSSSQKGSKFLTQLYVSMELIN